MRAVYSALTSWGNSSYRGREAENTHLNVEQLLVAPTIYSSKVTPCFLIGYPMALLNGFSDDFISQGPKLGKYTALFLMPFQGRGFMLF